MTESLSLISRFSGTCFVVFKSAHCSSVVYFWQEKKETSNRTVHSNNIKIHKRQCGKKRNATNSITCVYF